MALAERMGSRAGTDVERSRGGGRDGRPRTRITWQRALAISTLAFVLWLVIDAPTLQHNAQVSPVGARRTVALDVLGPIAAVSRAVGLSHMVSVGDGLLGRRVNGPGSGSGLLSVGPSGTRIGAAQRAGAGAPPAKPGPGAAPAKVSSPLPGPSAQLPGGTVLRPTPAQPLRVLVVGDSLGIDVGNALVNDLGGTGVVTATLDGQVGTGLTRPDYYNWPAELHADLDRLDPQIVVVMVGANDAQDFPGPPDIPYGGAQWSAQYGRNVNDFMREAASSGARMIWIGMPPMNDSELSAKMAALDAIDAAEANQVPGVTFVGSSTVLGTPAGTYTAYLVRGGQDVAVREPDGIHITPAGADIVAQAVITAIRSTVVLPG
jgi:lysophospholipase L1-like esterase